MSQASLPLKILTPMGIVYQADVQSFTVPSMQGPLMIEPGYTNVIVALNPAGVLKINKGGKKRFFAIYGGVLHVNRVNGCEIYTEEIIDGNDIDLARAIAKRDRNQDRISKHESGIDIKRAQINLAKALAKIDAKTLTEGGKR